MSVIFICFLLLWLNATERVICKERGFIHPQSQGLGNLRVEGSSKKDSHCNVDPAVAWAPQGLIASWIIYISLFFYALSRPLSWLHLIFVCVHVCLHVGAHSCASVHTHRSPCRLGAGQQDCSTSPAPGKQVCAVTPSFLQGFGGSNLGPLGLTMHRLYWLSHLLGHPSVFCVSSP